jgi:hypothetical protein
MQTVESEISARNSSNKQTDTHELDIYIGRPQSTKDQVQTNVGYF